MLSKIILLLLFVLLTIAPKSICALDQSPSAVTGQEEFDDPADELTACCTARGDIDGMMGISLMDVMYYISWGFEGGAPPPCLDHADVNGDGFYDVNDWVALTKYIFSGGAPPAPC